LGWGPFVGVAHICREIEKGGHRIHKGKTLIWGRIWDDQNKKFQEPRLLIFGESSTTKRENSLRRGTNWPKYFQNSHISCTTRIGGP